MKRPKQPLAPSGIIDKRDLRETVARLCGRWGVVTIPDASPGSAPTPAAEAKPASPRPKP